MVPPNKTVNYPLWIHRQSIEIESASRMTKKISKICTRKNYRVRRLSSTRKSSRQIIKNKDIEINDK